MHNNGKPNPPEQVLDVVVIGEALMDVVTAPEGTNEHPGGSPANVAYGLARLGVGTGLLTSMGTDGRGDALEEHLADAGVTLLPGARSLERTSTATATIARDGSANYAFDITRDVEPLDPARTPPRVVHTGSIASFLSPGAGNVKATLQKLRSECIITYDPNIRPALLGTLPKHGTLSRNWYTSAPSSDSATRTPNGSTRRRPWRKPQPTSLGWERTWLSSPRAH